MSKGGALILIVILAATFVGAQSSSSNIDKAYECLDDLVKSKETSQFSLQEATFSLLALGSDSKLTKTIEDSESTEGVECWPGSSCTIKDTSQVLLAYDRINKKTDSIEDWLYSNNKTSPQLTWFLQVDITNHEESACTLNYGDTERNLHIQEDMTISGNPGSCFSVSGTGYWLKVNNNCIDETFRISCDQDFITSLLYQRTGSSSIFVSPDTHSAAGSGTTEEKINSRCFGTGNNCDYEGTLWAALALDQTGNDVKNYLPYLLALADENKRYFPSAFLHKITLGEDQFSKIVQSQKQAQYWEASNTNYNRFYDTALALLSLQSTDVVEKTNAEEYLLSVQTPEGCWNNNNIRDTAFLLYSGWPKTAPKGGSGGGPESCIASGKDCAPSLFACADAGGVTLDMDCDSGVCCSVSLLPPSCESQGGLICTTKQTCSGTKVNSLEGSCCLGACIEKPQENQCELSGGTCFTSCTSEEEQASDTCDEPNLVCCVPLPAVESGGLSIWSWIFILFILVLILVLAILFRKKLKLIWFGFKQKWKNRKSKKGKGTPPPTRRPPYPPYGQRGVMRRRPPYGRPGMPPRMRRPPTRHTPTQTDKELEETMQKLRKMSE